MTAKKEGQGREREMKTEYVKGVLFPYFIAKTQQILVKVENSRNRVYLSYFKSK